MAYLNKIKDLRNLKPSSSEILYRTVLGDIQPEYYNENKIYNTGDVILVNENGYTVIKECVKNNVTGTYDENCWIVVESLMNGSSSSNPNKPQQITPTEQKMLEDIAELQASVGSILNINDTKNLLTIDFSISNQIQIVNENGILEFGRIYF